MLLGAYMWRGRSYDVSHKAGALLEVDSDVDVVASSGMCVGVCVCVCVRAGIVAVVSAKASLMTPRVAARTTRQQLDVVVVFCARTHTSGVSNGSDGPGLFAHGGLGTCNV